MQSMQRAVIPSPTSNIHAGCAVIIGFAMLAALPVNAQITSASTVPLPDSVVYRHLLRHLTAFDQAAKSASDAGGDGTVFRRFFLNKLAINDGQLDSLNRIAADFDQKFQANVVQVKVEIQSFNATFASTHTRTGPLPRASARLQQLQDERNALVLNAREQIKAVFNPDDFQRFDDGVRRLVSPNLVRLAPVAANSALPTVEVRK